MIKVTCDMCKKPIDYNVDGVNLDFNHYSVVNFKKYYDDEKQLCVACATRVSKWIDEQCKLNVAEIITEDNEVCDENH